MPDEAKDLAARVAEFRAELIRKGLTPAEANELAARVGSAASSNSGGHCSGLVKPGEDVVRPRQPDR